MNKEKTNILITGGNGFIGSNLIKYFSENQNVNIFNGNRDTISLNCPNSVSSFINENNICVIIHCAILGGNRIKQDSSDIVYQNLLMYETVSNCHGNKLLINIASGAEFDRSRYIIDAHENDIYYNLPRDYYGFSKNIIAKRVNERRNSANIRIFGCFDFNELKSRFIRSCFDKVMRDEEIIIEYDKIMDFIYMGDLCKIVDSYIFDAPIIRDINAVYTGKYKLSDIADYISLLCNKQSNIKILNKDGLSYYGNGDALNSLNIKLKGLHYGITQCYNKLNENKTVHAFDAVGG